MARKRKAPADVILVRATVNLNGLRAGKMAWVDPKEKWVANAIEMRFLVKEEPLPNEIPPDPGE